MNVGLKKTCVEAKGYWHARPLCHGMACWRTFVEKLLLD